MGEESCCAAEQKDDCCRKEKVRTMLKVFLDVFFIFPLILLVVTIILIRNSVKKLRNYQECTGTIIRFFKTTSPVRVDIHHRYGISPVIAYQVHGKSYEFIGNYYSSWMKVDQEIQVMYHAEDPTQVTVKKGLYVAPLVTGGLTLAFTSAFFVLMLLGSKGILVV